ncbi:TPA: type II toxin-antitoxin system RelB/DinJ family antitoxin [Yersinia enterocolitica]|nr:type II toxin-antitoxin system RelB/DinJ family antitoxin [Yersinia enterocolitica]HDL6900992.1 type II toxin-antitoxin system RelB/DinJ family antitoxin [Yersinia enterocolitica]HDL7092098.1 type II toxin-antitoxin system RelB/DinJ family antitoxin [Yersinia enterocolitica]HDL7101136.1 type II toxin-antitoxin system RelB/DinJ family antitoxin [Yersinia enterocolitica]HDL7135618.1 type II toxin-antitoxin system RelB/DinJ family antitoxin [Yersinia enterocolitica]
MATINVRIDDELKSQADEVLKRLQASPTQVITALYQYIATKKKLPFVVTTDVSTPEELNQRLVSHAHLLMDLYLKIKNNLKIKSSNANLLEMSDLQDLEALVKAINLIKTSMNNVNIPIDNDVENALKYISRVSGVIQGLMLRMLVIDDNSIKKFDKLKSEYEQELDKAIKVAAQHLDAIKSIRI